MLATSKDHTPLRDNFSPDWFPISRTSTGELFVLDMSEFPGVRTVCLQFSKVDSGCIAVVEISNDRTKWFAQPMIRPYVTSPQKHSDAVGGADIRILPVFSRFIRASSVGRTGTISVTGFLSQNAWTGFHGAL